MGGESSEQGTQTVLWDPGSQLLQESLRNRSSRGETVNCLQKRASDYKRKQFLRREERGCVCVCVVVVGGWWLGGGGGGGGGGCAGLNRSSCYSIQVGITTPHLTSAALSLCTHLGFLQLLLSLSLSALPGRWTEPS